MSEHDLNQQLDYHDKCYEEEDGDYCSYCGYPYPLPLHTEWCKKNPNNLEQQEETNETQMS